MANVKISDLTGYTNPATTDVIPVVDLVSDFTKKVTIADLLQSSSSGTASAPGFAFGADKDTGVFLAAPNQLALASGGVERLRVSSIGCGIGTSAPAGELHVASSSSTSLFLEGNNGRSEVRAVDGNLFLTANQSADSSGLNQIVFYRNGATESARINNSGNMGIGTASPQTRLDVSLGTVQAGDVSAATGGSLGFQIKYSGSNVLNTISSEYSSGATFIGYGVRGRSGVSGFTSTAGNSNFAKAGISVGNGVRFYANAASTDGLNSVVALQERMRIDSSGNCGIGITAPGEKLHIANTGTSAGVGVRLENSEGHVNLVSDGGGFTFETEASGSVAAIASSGNFGVGTTAPGKKVEISTATNNDGLRLRSTRGNGSVHGLLAANTNGQDLNVYVDESGATGKLVVYSAGGSEALRVESNGDAAFKNDVSLESATPLMQLQDTDGTNQLLRLSRDLTGGFADVRSNTSADKFAIRLWDGATYQEKLKVEPAATTVTGDLFVSGNVTFSTTTVSGTIAQPSATVISSGDTDVTFLSLPTYVKRLTLMFKSVGVSGTYSFEIQLGTSSGFQISSYNGETVYGVIGSTNGGKSSVTGVPVFQQGTANIISGTVDFVNPTGNSWVATGMYGFDNSTTVNAITTSTVTLNNKLDRIRMKADSAGGTLSSGTVSIMYQG